MKIEKATQFRYRLIRQWTPAARHPNRLPTGFSIANFASAETLHTKNPVYFSVSDSLTSGIFQMPPVITGNNALRRDVSRVVDDDLQLLVEVGLRIISDLDDINICPHLLS
ncbi:hypothetical protein BaRGS_00017099 [Batillaria attramentaria]|uniref:Uncharacterized protein n=1 Tax=Batillaria attramentaria TaxID=370345 RepID=A0ABD0KX82_9CAEN